MSSQRSAECPISINKKLLAKKKESMKVKFLTQTCRVAAAVLFTLSGVLAVRASDFPTSMTGLNPAAWWRFNETVASPSTQIASNWSTLGAAANGYVLPRATNAQPGIVGTAMRFIGSSSSSCIEVPQNAALNPYTFSVEYWVKADFQPDATGYAPVSSVNPFWFPNNRSGWLFY